MPRFGRASQERLYTCDQPLQEICNAAIKVMDFSVICGHRNEEDQNTVYAEGKSKLKWPDGKHNKFPSQAVDIAPYPIDWDDTDRFVLLAGIMYGVAASKGIKLRWGGNWDSDFDLRNNRWADLGHFEVIL